MASGGPLPVSYRVRHYGVDLEVMKRVAVPAVREALAAGKLAVIDEVGWHDEILQDILQWVGSVAIRAQL